MDSSAIGRALIASVILPLISATRWEWETSWCASTGGILHEGDFNGDGRMDILCHRPSDGHKWISYADANGQFPGTSWNAALGWCYGDNQELHIGDFNGDAKDDMLCHDTSEGHKWIAHANAEGNFADSTTWQAELGWCFDSGEELHIGDFDGDERYDMLCHSTINGGNRITYANFLGNFASSTTWGSVGWCGSTGNIHIGDFNGDSKDDLLCHRPSDGYVWISYATCDGNFQDGTSWSEGIGWCNHSGAEVHIGDSNGDGKDDLFCHDTNNGYMWVALANAQSNFQYRTSWEANLQWCYQTDNQFFLGDYNGDSMTDLLCHDYGNGYKYVIYASPPYE